MDETLEEIGSDLQDCAECLIYEKEAASIDTYFYYKGERFNVVVTRFNVVVTRSSE